MQILSDFDLEKVLKAKFSSFPGGISFDCLPFHLQ